MQETPTIATTDVNLTEGTFTNDMTVIHNRQNEWQCINFEFSKLIKEIDH